MIIYLYESNFMFIWFTNDCDDMVDMGVHFCIIA